MENQKELHEMSVKRAKDRYSYYEEYKDLKLFSDVKSINNKLRCVGACIKGKSAKYLWMYYYDTPEQLESAFNRAKEYADNREKRKREQSEEKKSISNEKIKIGDIYYTRWGYDQTNTEFYQVVNKIGKTMVVIREIKGKFHGETFGYMSGEVSPKKDAFVGGEIRKRIIDKSGALSFSSFRGAWLWGDKKSTRISWYA